MLYATLLMILIKTHFYSVIVALTPPLGLVISKSLLSLEEFALYSLFILINSLIMLSDVGITASVFKYGAKFNQKQKDSGGKLLQALRIAKKSVSIVLILLTIYLIYVASQWQIAEYWFFVFLCILSANNRWNFSIHKTYLFSKGDTLFFWKNAATFSLVKVFLAIGFMFFFKKALYALLIIVILSYIELYILSFRGKLKSDIAEYVKSSRGNDRATFDYTLGISSLAWVILVQLDKIYLSIFFTQMEYSKYILFVQLCTGLFIVSSTLYSIYGKLIYTGKLEQIRGVNSSFSILGSVYIFLAILFSKPEFYEYFLNYFKIEVLDQSILYGYLTLMLFQPLQAVLVDRGSYMQISLAILGGVLVWLVSAQISISMAWLLQAAVVSISFVILVSLDNKNIGSIVKKLVIRIFLFLLPSIFYLKFYQFSDFIVFSIVNILLAFISSLLFFYYVRQKDPMI